MAKILDSVGRYAEARIAEDLAEKMVFVAGPRQVGKTTVAKRLLEARGGSYLLWDDPEDRRTIRRGELPGGTGLVVLDEIHKWRDWKRWIKGAYDKHGDRLGLLVTGSARLDVYRRGGDSLQGRYHRYRLHPFSVAEAIGRIPAPEPGKEIEAGEATGAREAMERIMDRSGFPEPFLAGSARSLRRWRTERMERFLHEDVRDLENLRSLTDIETLSELVAERVTSPLSVNSLREDLEASHKAVAHWLDVLERLYHVLRVRPLERSLARAIRKQPKVYMWDPGLVEARAARFENIVALHLLKLCHWMEDSQGWKTDLRYLRDTDGRETDFVVTCGGKPWFAVEAKLSETRVDRSLVYYRDRLRIPWAYQVVLDTDRDFVSQGVRVLPAGRFLAAIA